MTTRLQKAMNEALAAIDWRYDPENPRNVALRLAHLVKARADRRAKVNRFMQDDGYWPLMAYLSEVGSRRFLSIDEAMEWIRWRLGVLAEAKANGHWLYRDKSWQVRPLRDRLLIARYFARFGAEIWQRAAA